MLFLRSAMTFSFWRYALFSAEALGKLLAVVGALYLFLELLDTFKIYTKDHYSQWALVPMLVFAVVYVVFTRRPAQRVSYSFGKKDLRLEVKIGDLLKQTGDLVISTNTTFDTDIANSIIDAKSLQGQATMEFFQGSTAELDRQLALGLKDVPHENRTDKSGNTREYPMGTVVKVTTHGKTLYFLAMARLNSQGNASSSLRDIDESLEKLWEFIAANGELRELSIPLLGTARGRIQIPRKKMAERIAQSFSDASRERIFSNKLTIMVFPADAENFNVNLFEVRDLLVRSLHH